jgi:hypothetical protein
MMLLLYVLELFTLLSTQALVSYDEMLVRYPHKSLKLMIHHIDID